MKEQNLTIEELKKNLNTRIYKRDYRGRFAKKVKIVLYTWEGGMKEFDEAVKNRVRGDI